MLCMQAHTHIRTSTFHEKERSFLAYQDLPARLSEECKDGMENTLSLLGDDAWCRVSVPCTVSSALSYLVDTIRAFHTLTRV